MLCGTIRISRPTGAVRFFVAKRISRTRSRRAPARCGRERRRTVPHHRAIAGDRPMRGFGEPASRLPSHLRSLNVAMRLRSVPGPSWRWRCLAPCVACHANAANLVDLRRLRRRPWCSSAGRQRSDATEARSPRVWPHTVGFTARRLQKCDVGLSDDVQPRDAG
jgi:hypothetical protein